MTVLETVLYFVVPSVGLYLLLTAFVVVPRLSRRPRYRVGQPWSHPPLWWTANPDGAQLPAPDREGARTVVAARGERGGARGTW